MKPEDRECCNCQLNILHGEDNYCILTKDIMRSTLLFNFKPAMDGDELWCAYHLEESTTKISEYINYWKIKNIKNINNKIYFDLVGPIDELGD